MKRVMFGLIVAIAIACAGQPGQEANVAQAAQAGQCVINWSVTYGGGSYTVSFAADGTAIFPTPPTRVPPLDPKKVQVTVVRRHPSGNSADCQGKGWAVSTPDAFVKLARAGSTDAPDNSVEGTGSNTVWITVDTNTNGVRVGSATLTPTGGAVLNPSLVSDTITINQDGV